MKSLALLLVLLSLAACQTYTGVQSNCWAKVTQGPLDPDCFDE